MLMMCSCSYFSELHIDLLSKWAVAIREGIERQCQSQTFSHDLAFILNQGVPIGYVRLSKMSASGNLPLSDMQTE